MPYLAFVFGALTAAVIVGLTAAVVLERARRLDLAGRVAALEKLLANLERVNQNPLYRESMEDQRARELRAADSVAVGLEHMKQAIRILAPEMLRKDKKK